MTAFVKIMEVLAQNGQAFCQVERAEDADGQPMLWLKSGDDLVGIYSHQSAISLAEAVTVMANQVWPAEADNG